MTEQTPIRYTVRGAIACKAHTSSGEPCQAPAMRGQAICQAHGGSSPQARQAAQLRLAALVDPAIATLEQEMDTAEESRDRLAAANSILDRAGYGRSQQITSEDARSMLVARLMEAQEVTDHHDDRDALEG